MVGIAHDSDIQKIQALLEDVSDPEVPVLSVNDLGIIRDIKFYNGNIHITITPTYSGCPAMDAISFDIKLKLLEHGYKNIKIDIVLSPAWTTEWMTDNGKRKLKEYGITPPGRSGITEAILCPQCGSANTKLLSQFGSTSCKALHQCNDCKEPFDNFKCH